MEGLDTLYTERYAQIPLDLALQYRDCKVVIGPYTNLPMANVNMYDVIAIKQYIEKNGLDPLVLDVIGDKALITDGNNRIMAAQKLGISQVPVIFRVFLNGYHSEQPSTPEMIHINDELSGILKQVFL